MKVKRLIPIVLSFLMAGTLFFGCNNVSIETPGGSTGETGGETGGSTGGSTGGDNGSTGGSTGGDNGSTGGSTSGDNGSTGGSTGGDSGSTGGSTGGGTGETTKPGPLPADKKIYVVGDSTVCSFSDNYYLPRYGYGTQLAEYLNVTSDQIVNLALSGRSSKSFTYGLDVDSANKNDVSGSLSCYEYLTQNISAGDYLIIGFGHNDEKSAESARFTDPNGTKDAETTSKGTSLKWCLYEKYIKVATDKGATPILCTPIVRYSSSADYSADKAHITADGNYPKAIKELGQETGTAVVDLTALTKAVYEADNASAAFYHAYTSYAGEIKTTPYDGTETPDGRDDTHINKYGAKMVAYQFANALKDTDCSLKAHVKDGIVAPTKDAEYVGAINMSFVKTPYTPFDPTDTEAEKIPVKLTTTTKGDTTADWYATAMGALGGDTKVEHYTTTYAEGKFSLVTGNGSKFAGTQDGFSAAFVQISKNDNFTASAHIKITAAGSSVGKQAGFGMMLRDDILINTNDTTLASNYVAAGLITTDKAPTTAIWCRKSSAAIIKESNETTYAANKEYDVSITRTGQTVVATFADGTNTFTKTYTDFDFVARDNEYMYLCLFSNRTFNVEFTNVQFEITGTSQGA